MKYLFFDIECANCYQNIGKICEFGYVIMNDDFQVEEKRNIFINPESKILLKWKRNGEYEEGLTKDKDFYLAQPAFPHFYKEIKELFQRQDYMYFAFSSRNDMNFLAGTLKRYHLPVFDFECYDAQKIAKKYAPEQGEIPGLEKMYHLCCIKNIDLPPHESSNDSYMTALFVAEIMRKTNSTIIGYMEDIKGIKSSLKDVYEYREYRNKIDLLKASVTIPNIETANLKKYRKKKYYLTPEIRKNDELFIKTLNAIKAKGLYVVTSLKSADFVLYILKQDKKKYKNIRRRIKKIFRLKQVEKFLAK